MADDTKATQRVWVIVRVDDYFNGGTGDQEVVAVAYSEETARKLTKYVNASVEPPEAYGYRTAEMTVPAQANEPRAIIRHFAAAMERKLAANDGVKGGWRDGTGWNPQVGLRQKLQEEVGELSDALEAYLWRDGSEEDVLLEAADVANVAMMLADIVGALPSTDERGR